jgi:protein O-mannosyl-transferase
MTTARRPWPSALWIALIFGATLAAYAPVYRAGLIWNDEDYVTTPALGSLHGLERIWFEVGATQQYYPALHSAFWLEHRLWGDAPWGYHLANVLLHALAACLLAAALRRLKVPGAWLGGFIFALHPIGVESVAWVSEQKNTLSAVFYLLAGLAYLRFDRDRRGGAYALATLFFLLAILSKSVVATLPGALLVVFWWQRGRLSRRDVLPLLPWLAAAAADGALTAWFERHFLGAEGGDFTLNFLQRFLLAGRIIWFYVGKVLWPANLVFIYPRWEIRLDSPGAYVFPLAALGALAALWLLRGRTRGPLAAALFFVGSLFPTLGFLSVFGFLFSYVADHWVYLPALGLITLASAGWGRWAGEEASAAPAGAVRRGPQVAAAALLLLLGVLTWRQSRMYGDVETLYRTTLERNPDAWMAHNNLGILLQESGRTAEAIAHYQELLRLKPSYAEGHNNFGVALGDAHRPGEAGTQYREALRLHPGYLQAQLNLANLLRDNGQLPASIAAYHEALRLEPNSAEVHNNLGVALAELRRLPEALAECREAVRLKPGYAEAHYDLGRILRKSGQPLAAIGEDEAAVALNPGLLEARNDLGITLAELRRIPEAMGQFEEVLRQKPGNAEAHYDLGVVLRAIGRTEDAAAQFAEAQRLRAAQR